MHVCNASSVSVSGVLGLRAARTGGSASVSSVSPFGAARPQDSGSFALAANRATDAQCGSYRTRMQDTCIPVPKTMQQAHCACRL